MSIASFGTCNTDTILDSGATKILFPVNYPLNSYKTSEVMADQITKLQLYGKAKYGIFDVLIADIQRPLISEGVITGPPYNLSVVKSGIFAWILVPNLCDH